MLCLWESVKDYDSDQEYEDYKKSKIENKYKKELVPTNCPNCGAAIIHNYGYNCEYCGTWLEYNEKKDDTLYKIKKGDNLTSIARKFSTTIYELLRLNKQIRNPDLIYAGDVIKIKND